jgi:hypothetical protein
VKQKGIQFTLDLISYDHRKRLERKIKWLWRYILILWMILPILFYILGYYVNITEVNRQYKIIKHYQKYPFSKEVEYVIMFEEMKRTIERRG